MKKKSSSRPDYVLLAILTALISLGIVVLAGISAPLSQDKFGNTTYYLIHQIQYGIIPGFFLGLLAYIIPLELIKKWSLIIFLASLTLLGLVFVPGLGYSLGGASRWVKLGSIAFQPSEFLKIAFIIYLAAWLSGLKIGKENSLKKRWSGKSNKKIIAGKINETLIPFLIIVGLMSLFLIFQPDISTLGIIVLVALLMYFVIETPLWHSVLITSAGIGALFLLVKIAVYRSNRILVLLKPEIDPMGLSYQIKQSLITIGSGGLFGLGLGMSYQKFGFLPESMSDSAFSIFAEETGFIGSLALILLFLFFFLQGYRIFRKKSDAFSRLLILGICSWITIQSLIHIGSMIAILPLTGIPLPFISYGGSHILTEIIAAGIILNISKNTQT